MFEKLIVQYVERLNKSDIESFATKNGIILKNSEIDLIYYHAKNNWRTIIYGNPKPILEDLKNNLDNISYQKIENLYIQLKNKYQDYL